ncbi:YidC/Oxa1 family membrane protein insertase [Bifidobacterium commune]|uniref:Membrane protein insertase YidC n=1 Tax=Bifidobacterium commune TaxID=1505727 RepID=A0A1C4H5Z6_9BIFI|nr:membrane protein insertase YidC [Bifidobacterium commune]MBB2955862.1 YidC/Oxa1 family membrane protein insertase [Bifidobacterium commune]SCC80369.1 YidC/Oxa1 family membrane protein insertase [Bifidobacterium commune]
MFNNPDYSKFLLDQGLFGWVYKILTPIEWLMSEIMYWFHRLMTMIGLPSKGTSWIFSIIFLVLIVHALVLPIYAKQMRGMAKMQAIQPKLMRIQKKYKGKTDQASKEAMSRETMKLYEDNKVNPMGSCLPMLIQGPVFMCMFYMLSAIPYIAHGSRTALGAFDKATAAEFADTQLFGLKISNTFGMADLSGKIIIGIFTFMMCAAMWYMQFNNMRKNLPAASMEGSQYKMQQVMTWLFPLMYIFSAISMPFAVLIYWLTSNICNMLRSLWQVRVFPTPGSPADAAKKERDHVNENKRREKAGEISIEEENLRKAEEEAKRREEKGYQRAQPKRKRKKKN